MHVQRVHYGKLTLLGLGMTVAMLLLVNTFNIGQTITNRLGQCV